MDIQSRYQKAIRFATLKHEENFQKVPDSNLPYVVHLSNVAMEILITGSETIGFDLGFAVQVALLHDTIEDTTTTFDELAASFGVDVALAVQALSKDSQLSKEQGMQDSLIRIKKLQAEVWAVKLADRITNLQPPPTYWDKEKRTRYREEAKVILSELKDGNEYLAKRLAKKIELYDQY
ncbi:MAG: HD domain-containing protein [Prolixibacteraceae bacterium]